MSSITNQATSGSVPKPQIMPQQSNSINGLPQHVVQFVVDANQMVQNLTEQNSKDQEKIRFLEMQRRMLQQQISSAIRDKTIAQENERNVREDLRRANESLKQFHISAALENENYTRKTLEGLFNDCTTRLQVHDARQHDTGQIAKKVSIVASFSLAGYHVGSLEGSFTGKFFGCIFGAAAGISLVMETSNSEEITKFVAQKLQTAKEQCKAASISWKPSQKMPSEAAEFLKIVELKGWWKGSSDQDKQIQALLADQDENSTQISTSEASATAAAGSAAAPAKSPASTPVKPSAAAPPQIKSPDINIDVLSAAFQKAPVVSRPLV